MNINPSAAAPFAAILAAILTAAIAYLTLTVNKENKISEFRQEWIDQLRADLAAFFSASRTVTRHLQELRFSAECGVKNPMPIDEAVGAGLRHQAADSFYRVKLRLNPKKPEHGELERLMTVSTDLLSKYFSGSSNTADVVLNAIDQASEKSREVLKIEWERVKTGELAYRIARGIALTFGLAAVLCLGAIVLGYWTFESLPIDSRPKTAAIPR